MFEPGSVIEGKYRVDRELGRGGMGIVVAATHLTLGTRVALKCIKPDDTDLAADTIDAVAIERFMREARAAAQLHSEHICRVLDLGHHDGTPYIVMELLEGTDLGRILRTGPLEVSIAVDYVREACAGLAKAHACGIVHRDLKPENLFLAERADGPPIVKLLDFGVAKAPDRKALTGSMQMIGSPAYMSPEQILSSRDVDARSDVWSLGVILYRLIVGRMPFAGINSAELMLHICEQEMPAIDAAPPGLAAIIARCLDKNPANRFATVDDLALTLRRFSREVRDTTVYTLTPSSPSRPSERVTIRELRIGVARDDVGAALDTAAAVTTPRDVVRRPRRRGRLVLGGIATVTLAGAIGWWFAREPNGAVTAPISAPAADRGEMEPPPRAAPTNTAPTNTAPTNTAPTNTAPTNTAPTNTAPTNTAKPHPRARPRRDPQPNTPSRPTDEQLSRSRI